MTALSFSQQLDLVDAIPSPLELHQEFPLLPSQEKFVLQSRKRIQAILSGKDPRFLLVVGPCSIHDTESIYEYAEKFCRLQQEVADSIFLVMTNYFEKPISVKGLKVFLYIPFLDSSYD